MPEARFQADFTSFTDAVKSAKVSLKDFETDANKVQDSVNRIGNSLGGKKLIQDAEQMTRAVMSIGGASQLTQKEQAKLNTLLNEAIEKYRVLGKDAPEDMKKLADATKQTPKNLDTISSSLKTMAGAVGIAFSVQAVLGFTKTVFDTASHIKDLSDNLGISTGAVQRFKYAAEQGGATIDDVQKGVEKLNNNLGTGDKATVGALKQAGLSFATIRDMKPEDAFLAVTDALEGITDQATRTQVGNDLLGKSYNQLSGVIADGFRKTGDAATVMSDQTIKDLEAAQQAWENLYNAVVVQSGNILAATVSVTKAATSSWKTFFNFVRDAAVFGPGSAGMFAVAGAAPPVAPKPDVYLPLKSAKTQEELAAEAKALADAAAAAKKYADEMKALGDAFTGMDKVKTAIDAVDALHIQEDKGFRIAQMSREEAAKLAQTMRDAIDVYTRAGKQIPDAWVLIAGEATRASVQGVAGITQLTQAVDKLKTTLIEVPRYVPSLNLEKLTALPGVDIGLPTIPKGPTIFEKMFGDPAKLGASMSSAILAAVQGGGSPVAAAAGVAGSQMGTTVAKHLSTSLLKDGAGLFSNALGGVISAVLPGVGALIGPLAEKLWGALFGTKGRDAVKDFASSMGGFDALHVKLNALGADGEQLWIKLTQGTGRNNPEQAAANIKAVNDALAAYETKQTAAAQAAEDAADKEVAASQKVTDAAQAQVDKLNDQIKGLQDSIAGEAPEEYMGIIEANTRAQIDAIAKQRDAAQKEIDQTSKDAADAAKEAGDVIDDALAAREFRVKVKVDLGDLGLPPGVTVVPNEGTIPASALSPAGGGAGGGTAILQVDGKTLAEVVVPNMPGVVTRYGLA